MEVKVSKPTQSDLENLNVQKWPIWEKEESQFDWFYDQKEICYFLEGEVEVNIDSGEKVIMGKGDLVIFPQGLKCVWNVKRKVRKHYNFE